MADTIESYATSTPKGTWQALDDYATLNFIEDGEARCLGSVLYRIYLSLPEGAKGRDRFVKHVAYPLALGKLPSDYEGDRALDPDDVEGEKGWGAAAYLLERAFKDNADVQDIFTGETPSASDLKSLDVDLKTLSGSSFLSKK